MTTDRAWRPRGPRFIPLAAIPFIAVALLPVVLSWGEWAPGFFTDPLDWLATWFLGVIPSLAIPLIGAAIVIRHPRPRRTVPLLLFGATLLALTLAATRLIEPIISLLDGPSFPNPSLPRLELSRVLFGAASIVGAFGLAYLASGLVQARRFQDAGPTAILVFVAVVMAVIPTALLAGAGDFSLGDTSTGVMLMALDVVGLVAGFVQILALGYVAVTASRGWFAGEAPRRAWGLAAIGAWLLLLAVLMVSMLSVAGSSQFGPGDATWVPRGISLLSAGGGVALLAAFALGLPDVDEITWYDLAELDAAAHSSTGHGRDPFDDSDASDQAELFELANRRLER